MEKVLILIFIVMMGIVNNKLNIGNQGSAVKRIGSHVHVFGLRVIVAIHNIPHLQAQLLSSK